MLSNGYYGSSFMDILRNSKTLSGDLASRDIPARPGTGEKLSIPHGTTILSIRYDGGVLIAGDRRATEGLHIADRRVRKVYKTDNYSAMAIAGAAGPCIEMARLFAVELEHYEKIEECRLTFEGKANRLSQMIKANLPMAMQGLMVVPLYAGYDHKTGVGRMFRYDVTGGKYEELEYHSTGSGGRDATGTLRKRYKKNMSREQAEEAALEALYDAAEEDAGTGGPDIVRNIFPIVVTIDNNGLREKDDEEIREFYAGMIDAAR